MSPFALVSLRARSTASDVNHDFVGWLSAPRRRPQAAGAGAYRRSLRTWVATREEQRTGVPTAEPRATSRQGVSTSEPSTASTPENAHVGSSVSDKLRELEEARRHTQEVLGRLRSTRAGGQQQTSRQGGGGTVDIRMYNQLVESRARMVKKLSESSCYIGHLEATVGSKDDTIEEAFDSFAKISTEFSNLRQVALSAQSAMRYGLDKEEAEVKLQRLLDRLDLLEQAVDERRLELRASVPVSVPVMWSGLASEVVMMGDFDGWTRGVALSSGEATDSSFSSFEGELRLLPGTYRVKLLVDGAWRLASDWPSETTESGDTNNILVVD